MSEENQILIEDDNEGTTDNNQMLLILMSAYLIFFMQCGFCMLTSGCVRLKNAKNMILKNLMDSCIGAIAWYFVGYALAFGEEGNKFLGSMNFALSHVKIEKLHEFMFQFAFAATAATIVSGSVAERTKFEAYLFYAFFMLSWVYPVVAHWVWSEQGWLSPYASSETDETFFNKIGLIDFAGCSVVHLVGGISGLAGSVMVGPRLGKFDKNGIPRKIPGHSSALMLLGIFILWFGWYGFNPGTAIAITYDSNVTALSAVNTTLSAATGCLTVLIISLYQSYKDFGIMCWDLYTAGNGVLSGLVSITAGCAVVAPWASVIIGAIGGIIYLLSAYVVLYVLKIDDPLDAAPIHAGCGIWGLLSVGLFAEKNYMDLVYHFEKDNRYYGVLIGGDLNIIGNSIAGIIIICIWVLINMLPFFYLLKKIKLLRVAPFEEHEGLDVSHHGGSAYPNDRIKRAIGQENEVSTLYFIFYLLYKFFYK